MERGYFWEYKDTAVPFTVKTEGCVLLKICMVLHTQLLASAKGVVWLEEGWESQEQQLSQSLMDCCLRSWDYTNKSGNYQDKSAEAVEKRGYEAGCGEK